MAEDQKRRTRSENVTGWSAVQYAAKEPPEATAHEASLEIPA